MRKVFSVALMAAMVCLVGMTKDAGATVTFTMVWTSTSGTGVVGTNSIFADAGDTLQMNIVMTTDQTLGGHGVSINFDTDLANELNFVGAGEWSGSTFGTGTMTSNYAPIVGGLGFPPFIESTGAVSGRINTFESGVLTGPLFLPVGSYVVGTARFTVNATVAADGADLFLGLFNTGADDVLNNLNLVIPSSALVFGDATVNGVPIPEPGTASLLGLGLVGLILAGRRSRR